MSMLENADPVSRAFLGVERSATGQRWVARLDQAGENRALAMSQTHGLPDLISRVLSRTGHSLRECAGIPRSDAAPADARAL